MTKSSPLSSLRGVKQSYNSIQAGIATKPATLHKPAYLFPAMRYLKNGLSKRYVERMIPGAQSFKTLTS